MTNFNKINRNATLNSSNVYQRVIDDPSYQSFVMRACLAVAIGLTLIFGTAFFIVNRLPLAFLHVGFLAVVSINYLYWQKHSNYTIAVNIVALAGLILVLSLVATGGWNQTGLYRPLVYLPFITLLLPSEYARWWYFITLVGVGGIFLTIGGHHYSSTDMINAFAAYILILVPMWLFHHQQNINGIRLVQEAKSLADAQERAHIGSWVWDLRNNKLTMSPILFSLLGITDTTNVPYSTYFDHVHPDDKRIVETAINKALHDGSPFSFDHRIVSENKSELWLHAEGNAERDASTGETVLIYGLVQDITERVIAEQTLSDRNKQLEDTKKAIINLLDDLSSEKAAVEAEKVKDEALINNLGDGLILIDENQTISFINPIAEKMLGYQKDTIKGKKYEDIIELYEKDGGKVSDSLRPLHIALTKGQNVNTRDYYISGSNKNRFPVAITASPMYVDGKLRGGIELFSDITLEKELDQAKDDFLALVSHQLQTPATAVKQFLGLILEGYTGDLDKQQKELINKAYTNNEEQINIIQDLLEVARIESGKSKVNSTTVHLRELITDIVNTQKVTIDKSNHTVTMNIPDDLYISVDKVKMRMCISNLLNNAVKYSPEKSDIQINAGVLGNYIEISVTDNGIGIEKSNIPKLFSRFNRTNAKGALKIPGTGLGLYLCKETVHMHGGKIKVDSVPGKGSTFTIQLPQQLQVEKS